MSKLQGKVIITAALNGARLHRSACPTVPYEPSEIAAEAERAANAGASVVHFCAREPGGAASKRAEAAQETLSLVQSSCQALTSMTTVAPTWTLKDRLLSFDAKPDRALIALGCVTTAKFNSAQRTFDYDTVDGGTFADALTLIERAQERGVQPVLLCHDLGQVESLTALVSAGKLPQHAAVQLLFGGVGAASALVRNLVHISAAVPQSLRWHAAASNASSWPFLGAAVAAGGHIRVGLEDGNLLPDGTRAETNAQLVEAAVKLVRAMGLEPAEPSDLSSPPSAPN